VNGIDTQYRTIAAGAGWAERATRGRLRFDGADRASFLHALLTNEVRSLAPGTGVYALYLTPQGRTIADLHLFARADHLVADVPAGLAATLAATFDGLVFAEDVRVSDASASVRQWSVVGARAPEIIGRAFGADAGAVRALPAWSHLDVAGGFVARTDDAREGSWDVMIGAGGASHPADAMTAAGAVPVSPDLMESLRIDAGVPRFGADFEAGGFPLEAGLLERAFSQTKGCYVGQEVIVRVLHRGGGRVARHLVRVECDAGLAVPRAGGSVTAPGGEVVTVTSAAWSPRLGRAVALGYVRALPASPSSNPAG
jgi:folate-binding protein YgfZ